MKNTGSVTASGIRAANQTRTGDLILTKDAHYHLCYSSISSRNYNTSFPALKEFF